MARTATTAPPVTQAAATTTAPPSTAPPTTAGTSTTLAPLDPEPLSEPRVETRTETPGWLLAVTVVSLGINFGLLGAFLARRPRRSVPARPAH